MALKAGSTRPPPADPKQVLAALLVESSDDAIIGMDTSSVITTWNRAAERLYGYSAAEVVGKDASFMLPPDRLEEVDRVQARAETSAGAQEYESKRVHKDGHLIDVAIAVSPIRDHNGNLVGTSARHRNITERKRRDAVAAELAAIVDSSNDAIIGKTLQGVITSWNRGAEHVYGYTAEEAVGKNVSLLLPLERSDEAIEIIASMVATNSRTDHFETKRVRKDGRLIDVSLTVSPMRAPAGTIIGASSVARDVTEHNIMAEALKASALRSVLAV